MNRKKMTWKQWVRWNAILNERHNERRDKRYEERNQREIQRLQARLVVLRAWHESLKTR